MKYLYEKNKKNIKKFIFFEYYFFKFKLFIYNNNINNLNIYKKEKYKIFFYKNIYKFSKVKIKNRCYITNNSNNILTKFNLGRHKFREYALNSIISGIRKSSW